MKSPQIRRAVIVESCKVGLQLSETSLQSIESKQPPPVSLNVSSLADLCTKIAEYGSVDVDDECTMQISDFKYELATSTAQMAVKLECEAKAEIGVAKTEECQSLKLESVTIEEKQSESEWDEASQLTQLSVDQFSNT